MRFLLLHAAVLAVAGLALPAALCRAQQAAAEENAPAAAPGLSPEAAARLGQLLDRDWQDRPEWADMAIALLKGDPDDAGWWRRGTQSRYHWDWLAEKFDRDYSSVVELAEVPGVAGVDRLLAGLDRDGNGAVAADDFDWSQNSEYLRQRENARGLLARFDADSNGRLTPDDLAKFFDAADQDQLGFLTAEDLLAAMQRPSEPAGGEEMPRPDQMLAMLLSGDLGWLNPGPALEDEAPDFTLPRQDGTGEVTLSASRNQKPVVLVFGSMTCGPYRSRTGMIDKLHARWGDRADFYVVYIREAHPEDGWRMSSNASVGVEIFQPKSFDERKTVAAQFCSLFQTTAPVLVDGIDDRVGEAYSGFPSRLYVIDRAGRVAYKAGRGPFGYNPGEMEQALIMCLLDEATAEPAVAPPPTEVTPAP